MRGKPKRIFLITVDCLRADYVGCIGGKNLTPNIDKFARESLVFTRAFANGPGTNQSFPAILTSTYFLIHKGMRLHPHCTTLGEVLSSCGFRTVAFHSNPFLSKSLGWNKGFYEFYDFIESMKSPSAFVARSVEKSLVRKMMTIVSKFLGAGYNAGIQQFLKKIYYKIHNLKIPYLDGEELNKHVVKWIERNLYKRFFIWIHYMDPHYPYVPPEKFLSNFSSRKEAFIYNLSVNYNNPSPDEVNILKRLYEDEVRYTDACIGDFLHYLSERGLLEDSLIVLGADHGHAFMEHGKFGHSYDILYNEVLHVPLLIFGLDENRQIDANVQLLDVPPTILDLLGIKKPPSFMGKSLLGRERNPAVIFSESARPDLINLKYDINKIVISCIKNNYKLIINEFYKTIELYDIEKDFNEKNDLSKSEEEICEQLQSLIKSHLAYEGVLRRKLKIKGIKTKIR